MEEIKQEDANSCSTKEVTVAASSTSVSDSSCDTTLPKLASVKGSLISKRTTGPTRRSKKGGWTELEDNMLTNAVKLHGGKNWKLIATCFNNRTDVQCLHRWQKVLNPELVKGPWTKEEDDLIVEMVEKYGSKKWSVIAQSLPGRIGKQCRERWHNHLNPAIKKDAWTKEEEVTLIQAHQLYGNKWAEIARFLPGRADNSIKNHWNCSVKKKLDTYSASGYLPGVKSPDQHNHESKVDCVKVDMTTRGPGISFDKTTGPVCRAGMRLVNNGMSYCGEKDPQLLPLQTTNSRALQKKVNYVTKPNKGDGRSVTAIGLLSKKNGDATDDLNLSTFYHSTVQPSEHVTSTLSPSALSLDLNSFSTRKDHVTLIEAEPIVTARRLPESPKRPKYCSSSPNSGLLQSEFGNYSLLDGNRSKVSSGSSCSDDKSYGPLCYEAPQLMSSDNFFEKSRFSSSRSPVCSTPPSNLRKLSVDFSSPESVLRSAAKSFNNTPSIIRKRGRNICGLDPCACDSDGICTPEVRNQRSNDTKGFMESSPLPHSSQKDLCSGDLLNVKWLSLSTSDFLKHEKAVAIKSARLESAFDMECDYSGIDTNFDANTRVRAFDNSPKSSRERSNQPQSELLDSGAATS